MQLGYYVVRFNPFLGPHWGKFGIHYYGLAYALAFLAAGWLLVRYAQRGRSQLPARTVADFILAVAIGTMVGGRLGYVLLYHPEYLTSDPLSILAVWDGGMASHGGMIGVAIAVAWFARRHHLSFLHLGDLIVSTAPVGLFFGRIANFINGELWGRMSNVSWAMIFPLSPGVGPNDAPVPRHPSQLYEASAEGLLLFAYVQLRFWFSSVVRRSPGQLSGEFFAVYAVLRIFCEQYREPDASLFFGLSRGTFYSILTFAVGIALIARTRARLRQIATNR